MKFAALLLTVLLMSCRNEVPSAPLEPAPVKSKPKPKAPVAPKPNIPVTQLEINTFQTCSIA